MAGRNAESREHTETHKDAKTHTDSTEIRHKRKQQDTATHTERHTYDFNDGELQLPGLDHGVETQEQKLEDGGEMRVDAAAAVQNHRLQELARLDVRRLPSILALLCGRVSGISGTNASVRRWAVRQKPS